MPQRILVHDYSGHAFQPQLSRCLASRGHEVLHVYSESVVIPQGAVKRTRRDAPTLAFSGIRLPSAINKQAFVKRYFQERAYGRLLDTKIREFGPDLVISSSTPLDAQAAAIRATKSVGARFVFWLQDVQGIAIERLLGAKYNGFGRLVGRYYTAMEKQLLRRSDAVVAISDGFTRILEAWDIDRGAIHTIPNWAPIDELPQRAKDNDWSRKQGLEGKFCFVYSGTLGLKHDAGLLLQLALANRSNPEVAVVVVSEGAKAEWLKESKARLGLENLVVLPFQPYASVPSVLACADVLVAVLDPDASEYSVPSKVLAYHCAGRPLLLSLPRSNPAARVTAGAESGLVFDPADQEGFLRGAGLLRQSTELRERLGQNALAYARRTFDIERIADRFELVFRSVLGEQRIEDLDEVAPERT